MKKIFIKGSVSKGADGFYQIIASTSAIDRQGDSIDQTGWDLTNFKKNPVLLWAHDYAEFPIGKITELSIVNGDLVAKFEFAPAEANPKAEQIRQLYEGGYVNASSVGFIPKERNGHVITRAELLELSLVPVPANQEALRLAFTNKSADFSLIESDFKGEVGDIIDAREIMAKKYENMDKVWSVVSALCQAYMAEDKKVEDFASLLLESIGILTNVANGDDSELPEDADEPMMMSYVGKKMEIEEKSGRRFSKKTVNAINSSIESIKGCALVLENLIKEDDQNADSGNEEIEEAKETSVNNDEEEVVTLSATEFVKSIQSHLRTADKSSEFANQMINNFLKSRGQ